MKQTIKEIIDIIVQGARLNQEAPAVYLARMVGNKKISYAEAVKIATSMGIATRLLYAIEALTVRKGDIIIDDNGRRGFVTELRAKGFFARPEGLAYKVSAESVGSSASALPNNAIVITARWFKLNSDGSYSGALL